MTSLGSMTFSGDKLWAIIRDGYKDSKSKADTGVALIPFLGGDTYAPGYFSYFYSSLISRSLIS